MFQLGDSHLNNIDEQRLRGKHFVRVRNHPGATSTDLLDHLNPILRNNAPDHLLFHGICNDLDKKDVDSIKNLESMLETIKSKSPSTKLSISLLLPREDRDGMSKKVKEMNTRIKAFCVENDVMIVSHDNINSNHLGKRKLHLSRDGLKLFAGNIANRYLRKLN